MISINVTELRQNLPGYLKQVQNGEEIAITWHGRTIARILPEQPENKREAAANRLQELSGTVITGDILAPIDEEWSADEDHL